MYPIFNLEPMVKRWFAFTWSTGCRAMEDKAWWLLSFATFDLHLSGVELWGSL